MNSHCTPRRPAELPRRRLPHPGVTGLALLLALGCSGADGSSEGARSARGGRGNAEAAEPPDDGAKIITRTRYTVAMPATPGVVDGVVRLEGTVPPDTVYTVANDPQRCGDRVTVRPVRSRNGLLADAVVWLDDVRSGKPLPEGRRVELTHERCVYDPRVQAVIAPSTLNVLNLDRAVHTTMLTRVGAAKPLASIPFTDDGQVVPIETVAHESGVVEAQCREHPWATAYLATFDHPYFAVTDEAGRFRLDGVPPGTYTLKAWHPRGQRVVEQKVNVAASGTTTLEAVVGVR